MSGLDDCYNIFELRLATWVVMLASESDTVFARGFRADTAKRRESDAPFRASRDRSRQSAQQCFRRQVKP